MIQSTVTARSQTTLPRGVRRALEIEPGDRIEYVIQGDYAIIRKAGDEDAEQDPALGAFLDMIERDVASNPERLTALPRELLERMRAVSAGIEVDLDEPIEGPVAL